MPDEPAQRLLDLWVRYPGIPVVMGVTFLPERVSRVQTTGLGLAAAAITVIALTGG